MKKNRAFIRALKKKYKIKKHIFFIKFHLSLEE